MNESRKPWDTIQAFEESEGKRIALEAESRDLLPDSKHGVVCPVHHNQGLTKEQYARQLAKALLDWTCPVCGRKSGWDEERFDRCTT